MTSECLTDKERKGLEEALGDGFETSTGAPGNQDYVDVSEFIENPLFGARVRIDLGILHDDDVDDDDFIDSDTDAQSDEEHQWWTTIPFNFRLDKIQKYFENKKREQTDAYLQKCEELFIQRTKYPGDPYYDLGLLPHPGDSLPAYKLPYTKAWFELKICDLFWRYDYFMKIIKKDNDGSSYMMDIAITDIGTIGRMVEHYRWKFLFEKNVLDGQINAQALKRATETRLEKASSVMSEKTASLKRIYNEITSVDPNLLRSDAKAASTIENYVRENRATNMDAKRLVIKKTGTPIGADTIRKRLSELRKEGYI